MTNRSLLLATVASTVIGLTACGDDDVDSGGNGGDASVPTQPDGKVDAGLDGSTVPPLDSGLGDGGSAADAGGTQSLTLHFKAKVGSEDMRCGKSYANIGTTKVTVTPRDFRLFIQQVRLITSSGSEVPFVLDERSPFQSDGVALLDFANADGDCNTASADTNVTLTGKVPAGDYTGISFINGVAEALNHADPTLAPDPLQAPGASWGWLAGYRFLMAEVLTVSSADAGTGHGGDAGAGGHDEGGHGEGDAGAGGHGGAAPGLGFVHLGSTACDGTPASGISCSKPNRSEVKLTGFNPLTNSIVADLGAVFATADLSAQVQCHGSGPACAPMFDALGVDLATGAALTTQKVYRVE